MFLGIKAQTGL